MNAVVFVEGLSDQRALERLAARLAFDLDAAGVAIVEIGGATNIWRYLERYTTQHPDVRVGGLCDANQEHSFRRALVQFGFGQALSREDLAAHGFFVCDADLEDELIRSVGVERVLEIIEIEGELPAFRTYQKQPAHSSRPLDDQVHGFMWNRKQRYATLLVDALDLDRVPRPLADVLASARA
ncbi:MAG TPA: TOPRIM nucleotidyl transferase/hydrolase domain-containing protein [Gaiellaceae bacterium]|nr:TOPRIM nucleotidyl transferase/hydrolase domain-containing protein [Gaiellaceae bacterium]